MYKIKDSGVIILSEKTVNGRSTFCAIWLPDFLYSMKLETPMGVDKKFETMLEWLKSRDSSLEELDDLGNYLLYARYEDGELTGVSTKQEAGCTEPILAKDVPIGTFLVMHAVEFFRFWKGDYAIDVQRNLVK